jgi:type VI secretion system secreted protein Hcp
MKRVAPKTTSLFFEMLEDRTLLSVSAAVTDTRLLQPPLVQTEVVPAEVAKTPAALTPLVKASLKRLPGGDPIYMNYGGVKGEVTAKGFLGDIQLMSFQWGVGQTITLPGQPSTPNLSEVVITKALDARSIPLEQQAFGNTPENVEIDFVKTAKDKLQTYYTIKLNDVLISGYSLSSGGDRPTESLSLNFTKIAFTSISPSGKSTTFTYDPAAPPQKQNTGTLTSVVMNSLTSGKADPIYIKFDGIVGDVTQKGFQGDVQLNSFSWGMSRSIVGTGTAREASAPSVSEIVVGKNFDSSSIDLLQGVFSDTAIPNTEVDFVQSLRGKPQSYLKIKLSDILISGFSTSSAGDRPTESLSLNFTKIALTTTDIKGATQTFTYPSTQGAVGAIASFNKAQSSAGLTSVVRNSVRKNGADPIYMKYGDIAGDVSAKGYKGEIELNSFSWGVSRTITNGPTGTAREASAPSVSEIVVGKNFDSSSVPLLQQAMAGSPQPVTIDFVNSNAKGASQSYLKIKLSSALISGFSTSSGGDRPSESLTLNYSKIELDAADHKGQVQTVSYDLLPPG